MDDAVQIILFLSLCGCASYVTIFSNLFVSKEAREIGYRHGFRPVLLRMLLAFVIMAIAVSILIFG